MIWKIPEEKVRKIIREEVSLTFESNLERAIERGVVNALKAFGVTADLQHEVQKDFLFLRKQRKTAEEARRNFIRTLIAVGIGSSVVVLLEGIKIILK